MIVELLSNTKCNHVRGASSSAASGGVSITGEKTVQWICGAKVWEEWEGSHGRLVLCIVQSRTHGLCNSSPGVTTQGRLLGLGVLENGDRWDRGRIFWWENAFHCSDAVQSPLIFSCVEWGAEEYLVSASAALVMTPGPGSGLSGPKRRHAEPGGNWTQQVPDSSQSLP